MSVGIIRNVIKSIDLPTSIHTFADVQKVLNAGKETEMLTVGMEMDEVTVGGEPMVWIIGNISSGEVIFVPKWCLATARAMNSTATNVGGWNSSALRTWLNGDFYNSLPDTIKPYIKSRTFKTSAGNQSTSLQSATDKIWLPREYEVFGATTYAAATEHTDGGAEQFSIFATSANRIKTQGKTGSACKWWESSPHVSNTIRFCHVSASGSADSDNANAVWGVLPCFRMTPDGGGVELVDINPNELESNDYITYSYNRYYTLPVQGYKTLKLKSSNSSVSGSYTFIKKDGTTTEQTSFTVTTSSFVTIVIPDDALVFNGGALSGGSNYIYYVLLVN